MNNTYSNRKQHKWCISCFPDVVPFKFAVYVKRHLKSVLYIQ